MPLKKDENKGEKKPESKKRLLDEIAKNEDNPEEKPAASIKRRKMANKPLIKPAIFMPVQPGSKLQVEPGLQQEDSESDLKDKLEELSFSEPINGRYPFDQDEKQFIWPLPPSNSQFQGP